MADERPEVVIATDGACRGNPGPGGWGAVLRHRAQEKRLWGGEPHSTNNRMELTAAIEALRSLDRPCSVDLYTDSQYVRQGVTAWMAGWKRNGWKTISKEPVKNQDLWIALDREHERHGVRWHWVRGHSGQRDNELADSLARKGLEQALAERAPVRFEARSAAPR